MTAAYGHPVWVRPVTAAAVSPLVSAAFSSRAAESPTPSRAAATVPAAGEGEEAGDQVAAGAADREDGDERGQADDGQGGGDAGDVAAGGGEREVAASTTATLPRAQVWRVASRETAAPTAPSSSARARLRRAPRRPAGSPDGAASVRGWGTAEVTPPLSLTYAPAGPGGGVRMRAGPAQEVPSRLAVCTARRTAAALLRHSVSSAAGSESATTPAPAWTWAVPSRSRAVRMAMAVSEFPAKSR